MLSDETLNGWLTDLRERLERGELTDLQPIELGYGTGHFAADTTLRLLFYDLDDLTDPQGPIATDPTWRQERREALDEELRRLHALLV